MIQVMQFVMSALVYWEKTVLVNGLVELLHNVMREILVDGGVMQMV